MLQTWVKVYNKSPAMVLQYGKDNLWMEDVD